MHIMTQANQIWSEVEKGKKKNELFMHVHFYLSK